MSVVFADLTLKKIGGGEAKGSVALNGKLVGLFFCAGQRCPPCERFIPKLREFYNQTKSEFEIVYVPRDDSEDGMMEYIKQEHGDWFYLPHKSQDVSDLCKKYGIRTIPHLVVIKPTGEVITKDGRHNVQDRGVQALEDWKKAAAKLTIENN